MAETEEQSRPPPQARPSMRAAGEWVGLGLAVGIALWALLHSLWPRADLEADRDFAAAAAYVKGQAGPRDYVLVRPIWELAGARAFLPLPTGVYERPVPALWQNRERVWVATAHGARPPAALRAALPLGEEREFGSVRVYRFDVRPR
jgi:hypothetical protein